MRTRFSALLLLPTVSFALYAPKGSPCAVECATKSANFTGTGDLVCQDTAYSDDSKGITLKSCISCLSKSDYVNSSSPTNGNSDQWWYLWHIKYVQQYCLIDTPQTIAASNCASKCDPMKDVLDVSWIYRGAQAQYAYCGWNSSQYTEYGKDCASCLQEQEGGVIIGNFADTMFRACASQPLAVNGDLVSTARDLFDSATPTATPVTSSPLSSTSVTSAIATTENSSPSTSASILSLPSLTPSPTAEPKGGLSSGASIGLGIAIGIVGLAVVTGVVFFIWRKRSVSTLSVAANVAPPPHYLVQEIGSETHRFEVHSKQRTKVSEVEARNMWPMQELDGTGKH